MKTDCLLTQRLPKRFTERLRALEALRHPDGTPVYRVEETKPLLGSSRAPRMEAERPKQRGRPRATAWRATPCCSQACRAPERRTWPGRLLRGCKSRARRCTWCPRRTAPRRTWAWGRRRPTTGAQKLDWLVVEEITQLDMALWADLACVGPNADVKFLLGDFRQLPAVLDSWAGRPISAPLEHSQLIRDLAGGHRHELTEDMRSDPGIFNFVKWLRVGEEACLSL